MIGWGALGRAGSPSPPSGRLGEPSLPIARPDGSESHPYPLPKRTVRRTVPTLPGEGFRERSDHAAALFFAQAGTGRQAEALIKEALADFAAVHLGAGEDRL